MRCTVPLVCAAALVAAAHGADAQDHRGARNAELKVYATASPALLSTDPRLGGALDRILEVSRLFRDEVGQVAERGGRVWVLRSDQVLRQDGSGTVFSGFDDSQLAEAIPVRDPDSVIRTVVVVLNLGLLERLGRELALDRTTLDGDIERILVHEVYAHAVPWLLDGDRGCSDPERREAAEQACSIRRENAVRAECGLGRRTDYGLASLTLGQRLRF